MAAIQFDDCDRSINLSCYRSSSPGTVRLENRIKELEDQLDEERSMRLKAERELAELNSEFDVLNAEYQAANDQLSQQDEVIKRREQEFSRAHRQLDGVRETHEECMSNLKRRQQTTVTELNVEIASLQKAKSKLEKEKGELTRELENAFSETEEANKAKMAAQGKQESLEAQTVRLRANNDDLQKRLTELNNQNIQFMTEATEYTRTIERLNTNLANAQRSQSVAEINADDQKRALDEESKTRSMLQCKLNTLQQEFDALTHRADEDAENAVKFQSQVTKLTTELAQTRTKYERELNEKTEESDELRRRLNSRINELTESYELERSRVLSLERTKNQLSNQVQEIQSQLDSYCAECSDQLQTIKSLEIQKAELEQVVEETQIEESNLRTKTGLLQRDLIQARAVKSELEERMAVMEKENKQFSEKLKETKERLSTLNRQVTDLESSRARLEAERDHLDSTLKDTEDALHECETKYQSTYNALSALRTEYDRQATDKDEELESYKRSSQRNLENLKITISDMETKQQNEIERLKKKFETLVTTLENQMDEEKNAHIETNKMLQDAEDHIRHLEVELNDVNVLLAETSSTLQICENRRTTLNNECEALKSQLEVVEKLKRKLEEESSENMSLHGSLTMQVNNLTSERRKLEGQIAVLEGDLDDINSAKEVALERADRLQLEVNRLSHELQVEQESSRRLDASRRLMETELKEINAKIFESKRNAENAQRELEAVQSNAEQKTREFQIQLDEECRKTRDALNQLKKSERSYREAVQAEDDAGRMINELREMLDRSQAKLKQTRRQLEEAESTAQAATLKYRKTQQQLDDADLRAQMAEKRLVSRSHDEDNSSTYGTYRRQRGMSQYGSRSRNFSTNREGSVFSVSCDVPSYKSRMPICTPKMTKRYESGLNGSQNEMTSSFSLMDLPPAETNEFST